MKYYQNIKFALVLSSLGLSFVAFQNCAPQGFQTGELSTESTSGLSLAIPPSLQPPPNQQPPETPPVTYESGKPDGALLLPATQGWKQIANTALTPVCTQSLSFFSGFYPGSCRALVSAWSGAAYDTKRNRLVIFGGGHNDYYGNEIYALDLPQRKMLRLNSPTVLSKPNECQQFSHPDGKPASRHSYGGLSYAVDFDKMATIGGATSCLAGALNSDVWWLNFSKLDVSPESPSIWEFVQNGFPNQNYGAGITASAYDPRSKLIYFFDNSSGFYSLNPMGNKISKIDSKVSAGYHFSAAIHAQEQSFLTLGGGYALIASLREGDSHQLQNVSLSGCDSLVSSAYPGLAYDSKKSRLVGWAGGADVYIIDLANRSCEVRAITAGQVPEKQQLNGTNGRFQYVPDLDAFVLLNNPDQNAYILRLN